MVWYCGNSSNICIACVALAGENSAEALSQVHHTVCAVQNVLQSCWCAVLGHCDRNIHLTLSKCQSVRAQSQNH